MPNILVPKGFNERIQRRILFDRNPRLALFADKIRAREYIRIKLGGEDHLTKLYAVVFSAGEIDQLRLPSRFVMKPTHVSGEIRVVWDSSTLRPGELEGFAAGWLGMNYYDQTQEWAYKNIRPRVMFEELLEVGGEVAPDYKFYCFGGNPRVFHVVKGRFKELKLNVYDMELHLLPVTMAGYSHFDDEPMPPPNFDEMVRIARILSAGIDFVRVDMYNVKGRIICGELTSYVSNGRTQFIPPEWDRVLGSYWK